MHERCEQRQRKDRGQRSPRSWKLALFVWGYALAWFLIENRVRLLAYRIFDPEQPPLLRRDGTLAW